MLEPSRTHSHDVATSRVTCLVSLTFYTGRDIHPMNKIVVYMLQREVRPVEFLRMLDKTVSFKMQLQEFIARCLVSDPQPGAWLQECFAIRVGV